MTPATLTRRHIDDTVGSDETLAEVVPVLQSVQYQKVGRLERLKSLLSDTLAYSGPVDPMQAQKHIVYVFGEKQ